MFIKEKRIVAVLLEKEGITHICWGEELLLFCKGEKDYCNFIRVKETLILDREGNLLCFVGRKKFLCLFREK